MPRLDAEVFGLDADRNEPRIKLVPFSNTHQVAASEIRQNYLCEGSHSSSRASMIWGPPKSGKSGIRFGACVSLWWESGDGMSNRGRLSTLL